MSILEIKNLTVSLSSLESKLLLNNVSFDVKKNDVVALVGGSGSGKTTTGLSILRLLPSELKINSGKIVFNKNDILSMSEEGVRDLRGKLIGMIFQEPLYAFNPLFTIGSQIDEVLRYHTRLPAKSRKAKIFELLDVVGLKDPARVFRSYPHQLSGGMRQRAMIAQAIILEPKLLIADEPTSNLDVTIQALIIGLFQKLKKQFNLSMILITHDLAMAKHLADKIVIMNQGKVVEEGDVNKITSAPQNEYTKQLLSAVNL